MVTWTDERTEWPKGFEMKEVWGWRGQKGQERAEYMVQCWDGSNTCTVWHQWPVESRQEEKTGLRPLRPSEALLLSSHLLPRA